MAERQSGIYITRSLAMNTMSTGGAIIGVEGNITGAIYRIKDGQEIILGRDPYSCDIILRGMKVSRKHCSIMHISEAQGYRVIDYSLNGCFLHNRERMEKERPYHLLSGEEIILGSRENIIKLG